MQQRDQVSEVPQNWCSTEPVLEPPLYRHCHWSWMKEAQPVFICRDNNELLQIETIHPALISMSGKLHLQVYPWHCFSYEFLHGIFVHKFLHGFTYKMSAWNDFMNLCMESFYDFVLADILRIPGILFS